MRNRTELKHLIGLLAGVCLLAWVGIGLASDDEPSDEALGAGLFSERINLVAVHDSTSRQYEDQCLECHGDLLARQTLAPTTPPFHVAMLPHTPGEDEEDKCVFCHRSVDLSTGNQPEQPLSGNLRKRVDVQMCAVCHGPFGPALHLYQSGPSPVNPDGGVLYRLVCEACHGELASSEVRGESAREIQEKIDDDEGGMGPLDALSPVQVQAISAALAQGASPGDD